MDKMILMTTWEVIGLCLIFLALGLGLGIMAMAQLPNLDDPANQNQGRGPTCGKR